MVNAYRVHATTMPLSLPSEHSTCHAPAICTYVLLIHTESSPPQPHMVAEQRMVLHCAMIQMGKVICMGKPTLTRDELTSVQRREESPHTYRTTTRNPQKQDLMLQADVFHAPLLGLLFRVKTTADKRYPKVTASPTNRYERSRSSSMSCTCGCSSITSFDGWRTQPGKA